MRFVWSMFVRCQRGACAIAARWRLATLIGAGFGLLAAVQLNVSSSGVCPFSTLTDSAAPAIVKDGNKVAEEKHMAELIETDADFESKVLQADKPVLVDFYADWCGPCKFLAPVIEELAGEIDGKAYVYKVDVDKLRNVASKYSIQSIPTVIVFSGGEPANTFIGVRGKEEYLAAINEAGGG